MFYCPFRSSAGTRYCMETDCVLWDRKTDKCLVRQALMKYLNDEKEIKKLEEQVKTLNNQLVAASLGFPIMNFGKTEEQDWSGLQGGL